MSSVSWYPPSPYNPSVLYPPAPYAGFGSSNQVYSNSLPTKNQVNDGDGEDQPSRPYIPDSGDSVDFTSFGSTPNDAGGEATLNIITLQPADATHPGGVSILAQDFAGDKRFLGNVEALSLTSDTFVEIPTTTSATSGVIIQNGSPLLHTFGTNNLFLGPGSGVFVAGGNGNVNVGAQNMSSITTAVGNTSVGLGALRALTAGVGNSCFGNSAGFAITTANGNVLFGLNAGVGLTTGSTNVLIGPNTGAGLVAQSDVIEIGNGTLKAPAANDVILGNSTSAQCYIGGLAGVAVGGTPQMVTVNPATKQVGSAAIPPSGVLSLAPIGASSNANGATIAGTVLNLEPASSSFGGVVTTGAQSYAGIKTFTEAINLFPSNSLGVGTIQQTGIRLLHTHGTNNTFLGQDAGNFTMTGTNDTGIGINALKLATTASNCVAVGSGALGVLTTGSGTVAVGNNAGAALTTGQTSVYIGNHAGAQATTPNNNVFIGTYAGFGVVTGGDNVFVGPSAGFSAAAGTDHVVELSNGTMGTSITGDIRIGTSASLKCYIAALSLAVTAPTSMVVYDSVTRHVGSAVFSEGTSSATATLDSGTITTMTVRGAATTTIPLFLSRVGSQVSMRIPNFQMTAQSAAASTFNLAGAGIPATYRPTYATTYTCTILNNAVFAAADVYVTTGGLVSLQLRTGAAFTLPTGPSYDLNLQWVIGA